METKRERWQEILKEVFTTEDHEVTCSELGTEQLVDYATIMLSGKKPKQAFSKIQQHLAHCPDCTEEVAAILELIRQEQTGELIDPQSQPSFDLTFLPEGKKPFFLIEQIRQAFASGRRFIWDNEKVLWINFAAEILGQSDIQPVIVTKSSKRKSGEELKQISLGTEELGDLALNITVIAEDEPELCTLNVHVQIPSRWPKLKGVEVVLMRSQKVESTLTDTAGKVFFREFPIEDLDQIGFKIVPPEGKH